MKREKKLERRAKYVHEWSESTRASFPTHPPADSNRCFLQELPVELFSDILRRAAKMDHNIPLTFCGINGHLRNVTLGIPGLWSVIDIMHPSARIGLHLTRSSGTPLDVQMSIWPDFYGVSAGETALNAFIALLAPHHSQIQAIHAILYHEEWVKIASRFVCTNKLDSLKRLDIGISDESYQALEPIIIDPAKFWKMEELCLSKIRVGDTELLHEFPTRHLRIVENEPMPWETLCDLLTKMPSLETLELLDSRFLPPIDRAEDRELILLDRLTAIEINIQFAIASDILDILDAPLESFTSRFDLRPSLWPHMGAGLDCLDDWWPTSVGGFEGLQQLHLTGCWMADNLWAMLFESLAELVYLRLGDCDLTGAELDVLGKAGLEEEGGELACPELRELVLDNEFFLRSDVIKDLVLARIALEDSGVTRIRSVTLRGWDEVNVDPEDIQVIRNAVDEFTLGVLDVGVILSNQRNFRGMDDNEDYASDSDDQSSSSGSDWEQSWASGDEAIASAGRAQ